MNPRRPPPHRDDEYDDNYDDTPLHHQKAFGSALKRKREVAFVRATDPELQTTQAAQAVERGSSVSDAYLRLVLGKSAEPPAEGDRALAEEDATAPCPVCSLPVDKDSTADHMKKHEASIAHQVCLAHSHPPSALDRTRMGFKHLESRGWDADARRGLGAAGDGILNPIRPKPKDDTLGLGLVVSKEDVEKAKEARKKPKKLSIKEMRKMQAEEKKRAAKLQEMFYARDDVLQYLGREL
ncbi:hypothetical protein jhhlp_004398 [Lomentospora prolificans]|uniref:G-patch domain-containing protein n=1 Tax=Lomentospora prolificans TaxID=41688 RepID=A0A2N3NBK7_9PEZI|nr:hypothetical protein jhhlp_004398 [Lomentospora prolificans]